jgi:hypothetical protein
MSCSAIAGAGRLDYIDGMTRLPTLANAHE